MMTEQSQLPYIATTNQMNDETAVMSLDEPVTCNHEPLQVSLLGGFNLWYGDTAVSNLDTRCQSLLAYLILNRNTAHTRQQIAFLFWPDSTEAQARTNLRKAIYKLRQNLPETDQFLLINRQTIQWKPDAPFTLDVAKFENSLPIPPTENSPQSSVSNLQETVALYRGDLLPEHYDDWILAARERLRQRYLVSLDQLILHLEQERQYQSAIRYAHRLLREDPLHEAAYRRLMRLQALDGNVAGALRIYHTCTTTLQRDLGVPPSPATQETYERLLKIETPGAVPLLARVPLVAREPVWNKLQAIWRQTRQQPQVVLLSGEAGIGKTRMAEELLDWAERQGITTVTAVCYAAEGQLPYAPVADWLRSDKLQAVLDGMADKWLIECARLLPELLVHRPELPPPGPLTQGWQRQHLFTALAHTILAAHQPLLLFVDDLQWCDQDTLDWLHFLLRFDKQARLLLLGAIRTEEVTPDHPLIAWQQFTQRDSSMTAITLNRLNIAATNQLAGHITQHALTPEQISRLYTETEGNPLFVVEMARANLQYPTTSHQHPTTNLPPKVQTVIETRLNQLSPPARELTRLAAAIGRSFTFNLLTTANGKDESVAVRGLDELWQRRIVRERGQDAYDFSHDKIRQVAYAGLSSARRRLLHGRIITALETLYSDNLDEVSGQLAAHYEATQQIQKAVRFYHQAANVSNRIFAHQETIQYLRRAITLLSQTTLAAQEQAKLYELLGDVLALTGAYEMAREMLETAVIHTQDPIQQSQLYRKIANTWSVKREQDKAIQVFQKAERILGKPKETADTAWHQEWLWIQLDQMWAIYLTGRDEELAQLAKQIRPVLDEYGLPIQNGFYFQRLMLVGFRRERYVLSLETVNHAQASLTAIEKSGHIGQIAFVRFALGMSHLWCGWHGNLDEAEHHIQTALDDAEEIGDVVLQSRCLPYLIWIYRRRREIDKVRSYIPRAMAVCQKAGMLEYTAQVDANRAWLAWLDGNLEEAQKAGQISLEHFKSPFHISPFWGMALWPLIGVNVQQSNIATAVAYAHLLLKPTMLRMPDAVTGTLQQAISTWEANQPESAQNHLQHALQLAQEMNYL
jgi:DNA-binding SARP family transcriptional activator